MKPATRPHLLLWDIDHTLIESRGVGRAVYERVFPEVTGVALRELAAVHGRTELDIMRDTLRLHDVPATDQMVERLALALAAGYEAARDELRARGRVLPGALEALRTLGERPGVIQTVLTGNTTRVAAIKLEVFDLAQYLDLIVGAFGDDNSDRSQLVNIACNRATHHLNQTITPAQATIIGDTPNDIHAARQAGARSIAVATGNYQLDELRAAGPTASLESLDDTSELVATLLR